MKMFVLILAALVGQTLVAAQDCPDYMCPDGLTVSVIISVTSATPFFQPFRLFVQINQKLLPSGFRLIRPIVYHIRRALFATAMGGGLAGE